MKKLRKDKFRKILAFMVALALMVSCVPSAYTISASETFGDGTDDLFTDGEGSSGPEAEESTPDVSSADQEKQAQQTMLTYENDSVKVTAEALEEGSLPQNTSLRVDTVNENTSVSYDTVSQKLSKAAEDKGSSLRGFFALDVYFADADGNRVEPNGRVKVTIEYKTPAAPELTDAANTSVTVEKLRYNSSTGETEVNTLQPDEDLKVLNVTEEKKVQTIQAETGNAAVFAVMWDSPETAADEAENDESPIDSENNSDNVDISGDEVTPEPTLTEAPTEEPTVTEEPEVTETPAEEPEVTEVPEEEQEVTDLTQEDMVTYTKTIDNVEITATAARGVLPDEAELNVTSIDKGNTQYSDVSEKLEAKAKEENYSIAGFLAYDIFFTDKDGNKIEPQDGKVKVSMAYTQAAVPEEITNQENTAEPENESEAADVSDSDDSIADSASDSSEDTVKSNIQQCEVSLVHLSEDADGQVKEVVDMTGQGQGNVETTDGNEVTRAEFETESFSTFSIIWKVNNVDYTLNVHRMRQNLDGTTVELNSSDITYTTTYNNSNNIKLEKLAETYKAEDCAYSYGYVLKDGVEETATAVSYNNIQNQEGENWWYESGNSWYIYTTGKTADVYLVYNEIARYSGKLNTVDNRKDGITVNLFDYDNSINSNHTLKFNDGKPNNESDYNRWTGFLSNIGSKAPYQGIMSNLMGQDSDGNYTYPVLAVGNGESASYLFSNDQVAGKTSYPDVNKLFTKDADGYYEYNSALNYAYLNGSNFEVYDIPATCQKANDTGGGKDTGGFFPFNPLVSDCGTLSNGIRNIESGTGSKTVDYHFGMTMSADFIQPEDGLVNGKDMQFEFSGDDDVWVYIDGVLVLDIGGIHDAISGSINFKTGAVKVGNTTSTTLKTLFQNAGESTADFEGDTFSDYSGHTINFYYLERGQGASNCHLKFNLTTMPEGSVAVEKQLSNTDKEKYANVDFKFQLLAQDIVSTDPISEKETYSDTNYVYLDSAVLNDENNTSVTFNTETIGETTYKKVFTLKPGQRAIFSGLKKNRKYIVREIGVKSEEYDKVFINKVEITDQTGNITAGEATVASRPLVVFTNNCSAVNSRELQITKKIKDDIYVDDTFSFRIQLSNQDNVLVPYANGDYYLKDEDGNYWYYNASGAPTFNGSDAIVCGRKTTDDGTVTGVPAGYTVAVTSILSGTSFRVEEVNLDSEKYDTPDKAVNNADASVVTDTDGHIADGSIKLGQDANVVVTNTPKNQGQEQDQTFIRISKTFEGLTDTEIGELANAEPPYKITVTGKKLDTETNTYVDFAQDLYLRRDAFVTGSGTTWTYTWKIEGCGTGTYHVTENNYNKNGYSSEVKINGTTIQNPEQNGVDVTTEASTYKYTAKDRVTNCNQQDYEIGVQNLIVAKLTKGQGTFVWTRNPASIDERLAIINIIKSINGFDNNATLDNCYFYSGEGIEGTMIFRGAKIRYDCQNILHFDYPKQWAMFATGTYEITDGRNAEVAIENTYTENTADLDLVKILNSTDGSETRLAGAEFDLYKKDRNGTGYSKVNSDPIVIDNDHQEEALRNLSPGQYYLVETKAPDGCTLLADQIYFKQENGTIILTDEDGNALQTENAMWSLSSSDGSNVLTIKNNKIYNLPSAGGPGIYGFTISGVAILATALLLFIKNKRREEEAKRS